MSSQHVRRRWGPCKERVRPCRRALRVTAVTAGRCADVRRAALLVAAVLPALATALTPLQAAAAPAAHGHVSAAVVTGRVADQDGHRLAGVRVVFSDDEGGLSTFFRIFGCVISGVASLGLVPPDPSLCGPDAVSTRTGQDGSFRLVLPTGSPVAGKGVHHLLLTGRSPGAHLAPATTARDLAYGGGRLPLGATPPWQPQGALPPPGGQTSITITPMQGSKERRTAPIIGTDNGEAWHLNLDDSGTATVDDRVLETGTRAVEAFATSDHTRYTSWQSPLGSSGTPTSRGAGCSTYLVDGTLAPFARCSFTDGRLGTALDLSGAFKATPKNACTSSCAQPNTLVIDLKDIRLMKAVIWRGCRCQTPELSLDGVTWTRWPGASVSGGDEAVVTGPPLPARYVRVSGDVFIFWDLRELSIWTDALLPPPLGAVTGATPACRYAGTGAAGCAISSASGLRGTAATLSNSASTSTPPIISNTAPILHASA